MATIYYPSNASVYTRQVNGNLTEQIIGLTPDTIFVFTTASLGFTSSLTSTGTSSWANSASVAISASWAPSSMASMSSSYALTSSFAISASWAPNSGGGTTLNTGSTYPITASWSQTSSVAITSSYSSTASYALNAGSGGTTLTTGSTYPITASWAISASWAPSSGGGTTLTTGSTYPITSSWSQTSSLALSSSAIYLSASATNSPLSIVFATNSGSGQTLLVDASNGITYNSSTDVFVVTNISASQITASFTGSLAGISTSASYAVSASYAPSSGGGGTTLTTGSTYPITSSWAVNASNATLPNNPTINGYITLNNATAPAGSAGFVTNTGTSATYTNAIGYNAGNGNSNSNNNFLGAGAGQGSTGDNCVAIGQYALYRANASYPQTYTNAIAIGQYALSLNNSGQSYGDAIALGYFAGANGGINEKGIFIGRSTMQNSSAGGSGSIIMGYYAGWNSQGIYSSVVLGPGALVYARSGISALSNSIAIGGNTTVSTGQGVILIGYSSNASYLNSITLGHYCNDVANNSFNIGNVLYGLNTYSGKITTGTAQTNGLVGINTISPVNALDVNGNISCSVITASLFAGTATLANSLTPNAQPYVTIATSSLNWITCSFADVEEVVNITTGLAYNFTHSNMPPANNIGNVSVLLRNTAAASSSLSFPAFWTFIGSTPSTLQAGKSAMLSLKAYDTSSVIAAFGIQY